LRTQGVELGAFARLARAQTVLRRQLETEVLTPRGLSYNDFEALFHLYRSHERRLRRVDLAGLLTLTPSGVTRLLDGLEASGFVENVQCDDDARVTWARLTSEGTRTIECVGVEHANVLRRFFGEALDETEVEQLIELLERLPGVGGGSCTAAG
jgi:MarR family transcriptional regulator, 2-MHQ and catechol-resistance regulon repressor